jgi:hypothetical protein
MRGLDPRIHAEDRMGSDDAQRTLQGRLDCRVKPGNDAFQK